MAWALEVPGLTPAEKLVLLVVASAADQDGTVYPPFDVVTRRANMTEDALAQVVGSLSVASAAGFAHEVDPNTGEKVRCIRLFVGE